MATAVPGWRTEKIPDNRAILSSYRLSSGLSTFVSFVGALSARIPRVQPRRIIPGTFGGVPPTASQLERAASVFR